MPSLGDGEERAGVGREGAGCCWREGYRVGPNPQTGAGAGHAMPAPCTAYDCLCMPQARPPEIHLPGLCVGMFPCPPRRTDSIVSSAASLAFKSPFSTASFSSSACSSKAVRSRAALVSFVLCHCCRRHFSNFFTVTPFVLPPRPRPAVTACDRSPWMAPPLPRCPAARKRRCASPRTRAASNICTA